MPFKKSSEKSSLEANSSLTIKSNNRTLAISKNSEEKSNTELPKRKKNAFKGLLYAFLSAAIFGMSSVIVKKTFLHISRSIDFYATRRCFRRMSSDSCS